MKENIFHCYRNGQQGNSTLTYDEVTDFLDACGITEENNELQFSMCIIGVPFEIDGGIMRFEMINKDNKEQSIDEGHLWIEASKKVIDRGNKK